MPAGGCRTGSAKRVAVNLQPEFWCGQIRHKVEEMPARGNPAARRGFHIDQEWREQVGQRIRVSVAQVLHDFSQTCWGVLFDKRQKLGESRKHLFLDK